MRIGATYVILKIKYDSAVLLLKIDAASPSFNDFKAFLTPHNLPTKITASRPPNGIRNEVVVKLMISKKLCPQRVKLVNIFVDNAEGTPIRNDAEQTNIAAKFLDFPLPSTKYAIIGSRAEI